MHPPDLPTGTDERRVPGLHVGIAFVLVLWLSSFLRAQSEPQPPPPAPAPASEGQPTPDNPSAEIVSRSETPTFKVNVNLVVVRVVVRDSKGRAVGNLQKDDFQLFDNRKPQVITQFSAEQPGTRLATQPKAPTTSEEIGSSENVPPPAVPERYIAYLFDDVHLSFADLAQVRIAADHHIAAMQPTDRAAIFTTSGQTVLDFTDDRAKLHDALIRLQPRPISSGGPSQCFELTYYMSDQIVNRNDRQTLLLAIQDAMQCFPPGTFPTQQSAQQFVESEAMRTLETNNAETHLALTVLNDVIRRMTVMPGQRSVVMVSPGFLTPQLESEYMETIDRAVRSQVTIGTLDARGLYSPPYMDAANTGAPSPLSQGMRQQYAIDEARDDADILAVLADSTGGTFFQNSNNFDEGFKRVASTPEFSYVLGFSPQNLKLDGSFHSLKIAVKTKEKEKLDVQARRGYFAPKHAADPAQEAKQEIEDALFSQEEVRSLPVDLHTQFFKSGELDAKLTVLAHIDVRRLRLRKADGRNNDELTVVSALFDRNGNFIQGQQKTLTLHLKDETLDKRLGSGVTMKSTFDVKPGSYLVRLVVRDAEAQVVSAENGPVRIP